MRDLIENPTVNCLTHLENGKMLDTRDIDERSGMILRHTRELNGAWNSFDSYVAQWRKQAEHLYGGSLEIEPSAPRSVLVRATVASKAFAIHAYPVSLNESLFIEVLVTAEFPGLGGRAEALRFLVSSTADVYHADGTKAIDALGEKPAYTVLTSMLARVLSTPIPGLQSQKGQ